MSNKPFQAIWGVIRRRYMREKKKLWNYAESYKAQINPLRIRQAEWEWEEKYA